MLSKKKAEINREHINDISGLLSEILEFDTSVLISVASVGNKDKTAAHLEHIQKIEAAIDIAKMLKDNLD
ncbi:hypothetical protein [Aeromonas media]|uniref:hypothetical protein n=1 Tax=Aeromonas media TaxID=651 RepID=UPI003D257570